MPRRLTHQQRAEKWFKQQQKKNNLLSADYSQLSKRMSICYEPAVMIKDRVQKTDKDMLSDLKIIDNALKIKL